MRLFRFAAGLLWLAAAGCVTEGTEVLRDKSGNPVRYGGRLHSGEILIPKKYTAKSSELRGLWIATVGNLDFPRQATARSFKEQFSAMTAQMAGANFNAVFFQIRPTGDAFYSSRLNPWSRFLTGTEGEGIPNFDPLSFMIADARSKGLEFHAWLNPYRVTSRTRLGRTAYLNSLAPNHFARKNPHLVLECPNDDGTKLLFLNPGEPAVIRHVVDTVREIIANYDVDAIHFDDYFYPYSKFGEIDLPAFKKYGGGRSLADWRRDNVTGLVKSVSAAVREHNRKTGRRVRFGISPFGIWANRKSIASGSHTAGKESYLTQYADTRKWVKERYLDYIVPQIYWPFGHEVAAYAALADWWAEQVRGTGVDLYIGLGAYQLGKGALWQDAHELANQLRYNCKHPEIKGAVLFSFRSVFSPANAVMRSGIQQIQQCWRQPAANKPLPRFK